MINLDTTHGRAAAGALLGMLPGHDREEAFAAVVACATEESLDGLRDLLRDLTAGAYDAGARRGQKQRNA